MRITGSRKTSSPPGTLSQREDEVECGQVEKLLCIRAVSSCSDLAKNLWGLLAFPPSAGCGPWPSSQVHTPPPPAAASSCCWKSLLCLQA